MQATFPGVEFLKILFKFKTRMENSSSYITSSIKRQIRRIHVVVVRWTSKKCTKKRDARAELLFWSLNLLFFWSRRRRRRSCLSSLLLSRLYRVDPAEWAKVFTWRKVGPAKRVTLPSQEGDPSRRVTLLAKPSLCSSCKRFAMSCKEMYEKLVLIS